MIPIFLSLLCGIYLHSFFPISLLLLPLIFFPIKYYRVLIIFLVIGTIIFVPLANIQGYHNVYGKVISSNGKTITVLSKKIDNTKLSEKIFLSFSDKIYKTTLDYGDEVYFKGKIEKYNSIYCCRISTKSIGYLPANNFFSNLRHFYISKLSVCRNKDIISSLLLAYKGFNVDINDLLRRSGFSPIFAISGLHIGLISAIIYYIFYFLSSLWKKIITIIFLSLYIFLIGFPISATRAVFMIVLFLILSIFDLPDEPEDIIGIVGITFLFYNPYNAYDAGFLMSFFGAMALILSPKNNNFIPLIFLFLFIFPLTSYFFSTIFVFSFIFQSIIVVPIITIFLIIGVFFLFFPVSIFLPALDRLGDLIYFLMNISAKMPKIQYKISIQILVIYYAVLFAIVFWKNRNMLFNVIE